MLGYGSTVWHGERGGRLFVFLDGKRMYLAAWTDGEVLLKENAAEALKWDFSETKAGKQNSEYYVPRVSSSVSTLGLGPVRRNLMIASQDDVKDAQGKLLSNVRSIRLALTSDSKTNTDQATGSMFVIRGTDSENSSETTRMENGTDGDFRYHWDYAIFNEDRQVTGTAITNTSREQIQVGNWIDLVPETTYQPGKSLLAVGSSETTTLTLQNPRGDGISTTGYWCLGYDWSKIRVYDAQDKPILPYQPMLASGSTFCRR